MSVSESFRDYVLEQLGCMGQVTAKSMFGGVGLYFDGLFFGLIANDTLYFKVDDSNRPDYEAAGMGPFKPYGDMSYAMQYYEVPVEVLENHQSLPLWAKKALAVARRKLPVGKKKGGK
ncbi:TfoX/Sxy family protein [candidate division KSB1 bacterium]|nr:TfoX/Sxy family protein [candidate division KSB1 bacterium]